ncbi:GNAT family N-acetyltransferase [Roseibium sp. HPY-6]|uniref:GNAT family N-acetyltransferase n=1 Tax=Roseibium sp. HPY-6 TaxID=3229852 RepID=UPI00338D5730
MEPAEPAIDPKRALPQDEAAIRDLARRAYERFIPVMNAVPLPMTADYGALIRSAEVWVLRAGPDIAASLVLVPQDDHLMIESIAVDPDCQGGGFGRRMLEWAHHRAQQLGFSELRLYTNVLMQENRAWYQRAGYVETHEEQRGDKRIVHMRFQFEPDS